MITKGKNTEAKSNQVRDKSNQDQAYSVITSQLQLTNKHKDIMNSCAVSLK